MSGTRGAQSGDMNSEGERERGGEGERRAVIIKLFPVVHGVEYIENLHVYHTKMALF